MKRSTVLLTAIALLLLTAGSAAAKKDPSPNAAANAQTTAIQILALNDFHGQLEPIPPLSSSSGRIGALTDVDPAPDVTNNQCIPPACYAAGGAEYLATHVRQLRAENKNTLFVSAGDLIGATPLLSALFHDEPSIEAFNLMGLDYNGVGNHEFDEGVDELLRVAYGSRLGGDGCHPVDGCGDGDPYHGATFDFLAANVKYKASGEPIFAPYKIHHFNGVKVGIVGMTLEDTPTIVTPEGIKTVDFLDEAETVNALVPELRRQNVKTIIVLLHEGGSTSTSGNGAGAGPDAEETINRCANPQGPLPEIVKAMDAEIDIVVTGHTNWAVNCVLHGKVVTGAASQGRLITDIDFEVSRATKDVVPGSITVNNKIVKPNVERAADITALIAKYKVFEGPIAARVIGSTTAPILRAQNAAGESALGDVIADAQLANTAPVGAQLALMNPGGIRADITTSGPLTYGAAFAVQPFSNIVVTMDLTGEQIERVLEQQFRLNAQGAPSNTILQVSNGFTYEWSQAAPAGNKVDPASIKLNGVTLSPVATYRVTVNSFLATGGDGFSVLNEGTNRTFGDDDLVALEKYFAANSPVAPGPQNRIIRVG